MFIYQESCLRRIHLIVRIHHNPCCVLEFVGKKDNLGKWGGESNHNHKFYLYLLTMSQMKMAEGKNEMCVYNEKGHKRKVCLRFKLGPTIL